MAAKPPNSRVNPGGQSGASFGPGAGITRAAAGSTARRGNMPAARTVPNVGGSVGGGRGSLPAMPKAVDGTTPGGVAPGTNLGKSAWQKPILSGPHPLPPELRRNYETQRDGIAVRNQARDAMGKPRVEMPDNLKSFGSYLRSRDPEQLASELRGGIARSRGGRYEDGAKPGGKSIAELEADARRVSRDPNVRGSLAWEKNRAVAEPDVMNAERRAVLKRAGLSNKEINDILGGKSGSGGKGGKGGVGMAGGLAGGLLGGGKPKDGTTPGGQKPGTNVKASTPKVNAAPAGKAASNAGKAAASAGKTVGNAGKMAAAAGKAVQNIKVPAGTAKAGSNVKFDFSKGSGNKNSALAAFGNMGKKKK